MKREHVLPEIAAIESEMIAIRRRLHAHPELGFEEHATSELVATLLAEWGYRVTRGLGETGVVGTLSRGRGFSLGLRADMDALPIEEETRLPHASCIGGVMHACGHDGHTAMLLAAAKCLAGRAQWRGTLNLIFQPAEEGLGGARKMIEDGLFEQFPCDAVYAMHNVPGFPAGRLGFHSGPFMASADEVSIRVVGRGGHGASPQHTIDPVVVCASIVMALQSIVARNVDPLHPAIVTVGAIHAGTASNVIPPHADLLLSVRALSPEVRALLETRITDIVQGQAASYGAHAEIDYRQRLPSACQSSGGDRTRSSGCAGVGRPGRVDRRPAPAHGERRFRVHARALSGQLPVNRQRRERAAALHNPEYDFNDDCLAIGASYWVMLAERILQ